MVEVSIVLPAYNEAKRIEETVERTAAALREIASSFEIIIAEDGSIDGTDKICESLARKYNFVMHLHSEKRQGRGRALNRAFKESKGEILGYIDVDLATDMNHLKELIQSIRDGYDFATGSRMLPESNVKRPLKRGFASKGFNYLTRLMLGSKLYDHQCGFKSFRRETMFALMDEIKDTHWFWDTELFVRAQRAGYRVKEFPVVWKHGGTTKVNLVKDVFGMGSQIFRLWYEFLWD
ncbi:MAG: glycosyltransferase family 2 protein [Candidatus Methanoperedens sp.]|nr:MAG: glycosyltransferase family 2 protein [Candidatus Methanoperedens sp.]MBZ0176615.1 glycosyltransferase family 2 protein [Candidatus Methanoperedens nitroreducens]